MTQPPNTPVDKTTEVNSRQGVIPPDSFTTARTHSDRRWIICVVTAGFLGSVVLYFLNVPPILTSMFLASGVASLVYHFLGGIDPHKTTFDVGTFRIVGSLAALVGVALLVNQYLMIQQVVRMAEKDLLGQWNWVYGQGGWEGFLDFKKDSNGQLTYGGYVTQYKDSSECNPRLKILNGKAELVEGHDLNLEADVVDCRYKDSPFHLKSSEPLRMLPAFRGILLPDPDSKATGRFGIMIYKHQGP